MFSMTMLSRRISTRVLVQAFTTRASGVATRAQLANNHYQFVPRQFSSARGVAVEEDLDAALDNLLGDAIKDAEGGEHMKDSRPVPPALVETVS